MKTTQEKFDALIAEDGAEAVILAIKNHVYTLSGDCGPAGCPPKYYCDNGQCKLNIGLSESEV
jgi:hypothetical protein